ncbi:MAG: amidohydrolase family protein [Alphaproteobacteria bacterium]|nr:amidohydrolase family protein [Alphaproteobacteria bacterium]
MSAIDADAHVVECEATFDYVDPEFHDLKPRVMWQQSEDVLTMDNEGKQPQREFWVIDGRIHPKEGNIGHNTSKDSREMSSIAARLDHMDALEIDIQVLYPTVFLRAWTNDPTVEYALCRSYNRWLAEIWKAAPDRLKWVVMPPLLRRDKAAEELRFAKDHGAVGVFLRGIECEKQLDNPYFFPLYELGQELDLAMCLHAGNGSLTHHEIYKGGGLARGKLPVVSAFSQLLFSGIPAKFPKLRWGFIEVSAQWLPYVLNDMELRYRRRGEPVPETLLADNNFYVACQVTDDLERILPLAGDGQLVIGTDYGHHDTSTEIEALRLMRDGGRISADAADRILDANARALYGL